ncbi:MAG: WYL domain-containing protein [Saprospiraceae bacterium]
MATNLHAALRYNIIDQCLRDVERTYKWKDLALKCYDELILRDSKYKLPSRRAVMYDIHYMRSGILGYEAPIEYNNQKGYYYSEPTFSIHKASLTNIQLRDLNNALYLLRQLTKNNKLAGILASIEVISQKLNVAFKQVATDQIIYFEESFNEQGQKWIDALYYYIQNTQAINIQYKPFDKDEQSFIFSPYILKEYNNRWYVIGYHHDLNQIINIALDRIQETKPSFAKYINDEHFSHDHYYKNIYGVTVMPNAKVEKIEFIATTLLSQYLDTKPLHATQIKLKESKDGDIYQVSVIMNYEITRKLFGFADDIKILSPKALQKEIYEMANSIVANRKS